MMRRMNFLKLLLLLCLTLLVIGCSSQPSRPNTRWVEIAGRSNPQPIYRVKVPLHWQRIEPTGDRQDTTVAIAEFSVDNKIRITIHNFPVSSPEERIPPNAQIARWKRQFEKLNPTSVQVSPQAFSGYSGLVFEGNGEIKGQPATMLGWSMQLAPEFYRQPLNANIKADYTIKVQGDPARIETEKKALFAFARSFELIHPIPLSL